jgi:hypothetical protein
MHRRNLEPLAARLAGELVVDADQVIAQLGELGAVALVGVAGQPVFLRPAHPLHLVVIRAAAPRTREAAVSLLGPFVEEGAFVECHHAILSAGRRSGADVSTVPRRASAYDRTTRRVRRDT